MIDSPSHAERPLRVLVALHAFPPEAWAGTEVYALELASALARLGHAPVVVARATARDGEADWNVTRGTFRDLPVLRVARRLEGLSVGATYKPPGARAVFERILDEERPDVVHFQHLMHLSVEWLDVLRERGIPCAITYNDYWSVCARVQMQRLDGRSCAQNQGHGCIPCLTRKPPALIPLARRALPLIDAVVRGRLARLHPDRRLGRLARNWIETVDRHAEILARCGRAELGIAPSRFLRAKLLDTGYFDPARLVHSMYGMRAPVAVAPKLLRPAGVALRAGFVGSLVPYKGVETLVRAMRHVRDLDIELTIHGEHRPADDAFHRRLAELAHGTRTRFAGGFDNARIADVHRAIDVLVVPSTWYENSPLTIHEAFLHGTPVVTSDLGGMRECVRDEVDGLLAPAGDEHALAAALARLATERGLLERLRGAAPRVKSIAVDAEEMVVRYRALLGA